jgi:hypothetical protein
LVSTGYSKFYPRSLSKRLQPTIAKLRPSLQASVQPPLSRSPPENHQIRPIFLRQLLENLNKMKLTETEKLILFDPNHASH